MDMKKILQALDGASSKPVEGSDDMKRFLRAVTEADVNQPAEPPMPGQNMPPAQVNLDHIDAKTLDSAEGFKSAMKQAATEAGVESETAQMVDKLVAAAPDGTVDIQKTFVTIVAQFSDQLGELVKMIQDLALSYKKAMDSPEFQQFDDETKQSVKAAFAELTAMIPKIVADAKKMSADAKGMQAQTAPAPQATNEQTGMSRFLSIVTEGKGLQPIVEEIEDLGNGAQKKTNPDGTYEIGDGSGLKLYSADGKLLKVISPTFNGFSTETDTASGEVTTRYNSGPMDVQQTKDKTGKVIATKSTADLGLGTLGYEKDRNDITTKSWAPRAAGEDPITQKDMYAMGNKDKEATYDRAMKQVATNEEIGMSRFLSIVTESKGPSNRLTTAESIAMQSASKKKTITNPVLNVSEDAKPSMIGKYFKAVEQELLEAEERSKERATNLAKRVIERVTIGPDGQVTGGLKPTPADPNAPAKPEPAAEPPATLPGKDLPRAEKADREAQTVTVDGQEYQMVWLEPGGIRPRGGEKFALPMAMLGFRGIGNYIGIIAGNKAYILPKGEQESADPGISKNKETAFHAKLDKLVHNTFGKRDDELAEDLNQLFDLRNKIEEAIKQRLDPKCWKGKKIGNPKTKIKGGVRVNNCVPAEEAVNPAQQAAIAVNMKKAGKKPKTEGLKDPADNPCWSGYKPVGTKKKAGKTVPNCVPKEAVQKTGPAGQLRGTDKVDVKGTVLGSPEKSQKGLRNKLVGGGA